MRKPRTTPDRADCPACGKRRVAVQVDGKLWPHQRPGWGLWEPEGTCDNRVPGQRYTWAEVGDA